ncbi:translation initiation factor IF-2 [Petrocella sp. FN5]|uniref:translation initiation factor IF-2 n=1 Tax=Petrocella sp. FN5 TaxID=3032002 RepID=UPI0023DB3291|nr:translation initiation factor IF-2 [Petrocella sp. FN5]MDF1616363.1 translation initiation factor IF-2 [Petrocella sp. FN5]
MSKIRVYELAKELDVTNKALIEVLRNLKVDIKNHMSSLTEEEYKVILDHYKKDEKEDEESKPEEENTIESAEDETQKKTNKKRHKNVEEVVEEKEFIELPESVMVSLLADKLELQVSDIIKILMNRGIMATANQEIPFELAEEIAMEHDMLVVREPEKDIVELFFEDKDLVDREEDLIKRSPVVVVMGHVDHGKTSLLDALRESNVTEKEHGGITQHIGASVVSLDGGETITFLDTPGHEAFTAMRLRGAMATDIAILVVAADDGVMPQTVEAINHAKAAGVQIIVAVNKIDKPGANPDRVLQELVEYGLIAEAWGGDTICVQVSALERTNLEELLEMIVLVAEVEDYKANPNRKARGTIIEAQLDKGRGPVATVLIQNGTLSVGDAIIAGPAYGRIRAMVDDKGRRVKSAGPSTPVEILGLSEVPTAGDAFFTAKDEKQARQLANKVVDQSREKMIQTTPQKVTLDDLFHQIQVGEMKELNVIVKADVQGSVEAVKQSLMKLSNEEVVIRVLHGGVGAVTETDVMLASASNAIIIGFNVRPEASATAAADREQIDLRLYRVIYNAIEDIQAAMTGMLDPIYEEKVLGHIEIRQTFKVSGVGTIGGGFVLDGKVVRNSSVRLVRDGIVIYEGALASLKRFKDDVKEVNTGYECGVMLDKYNDLRDGDVVEAFAMVEIPRK